MKKQSIASSVKDRIFFHSYEIDSPKALVLIIHGMQEHAGRYASFAEFLNSKNFSVVVSELRGHDSYVTGGNEGFDEGDIFTNIVRDQEELIAYFAKKFKKPIYVVGHSYGSFIAQRLIVRDRLVKKFVLSGSAYTNTPIMWTAGIISFFGKIFVGKKKRARLIEKLSFGSYAKKFENGNWLSRDEEIWKYYTNDERCGNPFPYNFYASFFRNLVRNYRGIENARKDRQILIVSGDSDPVGNNGKLPLRLFDFYKRKGLDVSIKIYEDARHEVLNEINRREVFEDIAKFLVE